MIDSLQYDEIIASITYKLRDPAEYVRRVLEKFYELDYDKKRLQVRIGINGRGIIPNYRMELINDYQGFGIEFSTKTHVYDATVLKVYSGSSHKIVSEMDNFDDINWSYRAMSFDEVRQLLGRIRKINTRHI